MIAFETATTSGWTPSLKAASPSTRPKREETTIASPSAIPSCAAVRGFSSTPRVWAAPCVIFEITGIVMFSAKFVSAVLNVIAYSGYSGISPWIGPSTQNGSGT